MMDFNRLVPKKNERKRKRERGRERHDAVEVKEIKWQ